MQENRDLNQIEHHFDAIHNQPNGAVFSHCNRYRYFLWRNFDSGQGIVTFLGLNPSTADSSKDDPTMRRCTSFAKNWGFSGFWMINLFARKATVFKQVQHEKRKLIGRDNLLWWDFCQSRSQMIIGCWGNPGAYLEQDKIAHEFFESLHLIRLNRSGQPAHPLYLPGHLNPIPWDR